MAKIENMNFKEIAEKLGIPHREVFDIYKQAIEKLKKAIPPYLHIYLEDERETP